VPGRANNNKLQNILVSVVLSQYFISLVLSILIILLVPVRFSKYTIKIVDSDYPEKPDGKIFFKDMDNDGNSEEIIFFHNVRDEAAVKITDHNGIIIGQWALSGIYPGKKDFLMFSDYNHNNLKDIFLINNIEDSLFLNCFEFGTQDFIFEKRFLTTVSKLDGKVDFSIAITNVNDISNDGFDEVIINVNAGFSFQPRSIFLYDVVNDSLHSTPEKGSVNYVSEVVDINNDGKLELLLNCGAPGNIPSSSDIPFTDRSSWLMVLNDELDFLFEPVEFKGESTGIDVLYIKDESGDYLCVLLNNEGSSDVEPKLMIYSTEGELLNSISLERYLSYDVFMPDDENRSTFYFLEKYVRIKKMDSDLNAIKIYDLALRDSPRFELDVDNDLNNELVFINEPGRIIVCRNDLSYPVSIDIPVNIKRYFNFSLILKNNEYPALFVQTVDMWYVLEYRLNRVYFWTIPLWIGIFLAFLFFILLIQKLQRIRLEKGQKTRKKITELQLKSTKGQLDPHFVYNALNAMGTMFYQGDKEEADKFFTRFSKLIRSTLDNSDSISVTLKEELDFVKNYIKLQRTRFDNKFDFKIVVSKEVNPDQKIPKMLIQTFVENSIKHGLSRKEKDGLLKVSIEKVNKAIQIEIDDNGIGFQQAKEHAIDSTGKGLQIVDQVLELYKTITDSNISYKIIDKGLIEGETGTRVEVMIECDNA